MGALSETLALIDGTVENNIDMDMDFNEAVRDGVESHVPVHATVMLDFVKEEPHIMGYDTEGADDLWGALPNAIRNFLREKYEESSYYDEAKQYFERYQAGDDGYEDGDYDDFD